VINLSKDAVDLNIAVDTIAYKARDNASLRELNRQGPRRLCKDAHEVRAQLASVGDEIAKQYDLTFLALVPQWRRGQYHTFQISIRNEVFSSTMSMIGLPPECGREPPLSFTSIFVRAVGVLLAVPVLPLIFAQRRPYFCD
jgi:hypothetical protein